MRHAASSAGDALLRLYQQLADDVRIRSPRCSASGRCCKFESWGHRLYVTGFETAYLWARLAMPQRPGVQAVLDSRAAGGCPFQPERLCTVHTLRPLGCRIFFCDETATAWQEETYERYQREVRSLHDIHQIPYVYAEWRALLETLAASAVSRSWPVIAAEPGPANTGLPGSVSISIHGSPPRDVPS
ncbi:MAG TPA: YkgJ family cysteine cluster protein [Phycisphaerales bacterium]|nr:YkgJ family cysteine cluster protein [Phycisphaerales bacterium]